MTRENLDRYALAARVHELLAPELTGEGWDLVDVRIFKGGGRLQVRIYVDLPGDERIDLAGCTRASRSASMFLEEADLFPDAWVLEVSSPGIRRPLRTEAHFTAAIGRELELKWRPPEAPTGRPTTLRGRIERVEDGLLTVLPTGSEDGPDAETPETVTMPLGAVLEANLEQDFDVQAVIRDDRRRRKEDKRDQRALRRKTRKGRPKNAAQTAEEDEDGS